MSNNRTSHGNTSTTTDNTLTFGEAYVDSMDRSRILSPVSRTGNNVKCKVYFVLGKDKAGFMGFTHVPASLFEPKNAERIGFTLIPR